MADLTQEEWTKKFEADSNAVLIDVRSEGEYSQGHIPNSLLIDIYKGQGFIYEIDELDKSKSYYVYCRSGVRSRQACAIMNKLGFDSAYNLIGGIINWKGEIAFPEH